MPSQQPDDIENKFMTATKFAGEIEKLVVENHDMNYIDSVVHFCELNSIELDGVSELISKPLKEKLKYDAQRLNFIKKTSRAKLMF